MQALSNAEGTLREFVANSAVFVGMSDVWYEKLYKTEVKGSVANDVGALSRLDELLSKIMDLSLAQTAEPTAEAFANATFAALQHTLLHGGEFRYFSLEDADQLQADLRAFKVSKLYSISASRPSWAGGHLQLRKQMHHLQGVRSELLNSCRRCFMQTVTVLRLTL